MDNKKRKIVGVAVISGVILVSVASVGTVQLIRENNAQVANKYVTAQASDFDAVEEDLYYKITDEDGHELFSYKRSSTDHKIYIASSKATNVLATDGLSVVTPPTKAGYTFEGYYYTYSGTEYQIIDSEGKLVYKSSSYANLLFNDKGSVSLTSKWKRKTLEEDVYYSVKDNNNKTLFSYTKSSSDKKFYASSGKGSHMEMVNGLSLVTPPTKTGYVFSGYYYTNEAGKEYQIIDGDGNLVMNSNNEYIFSTIIDNLVLEEKWTADYHTVTDENGSQLFVYTKDGNGDIVFTSYVNKNVVFADGIYLVYPPTKSGYTFNGYYYTYSGKEYQIIDSEGKLVAKNSGDGSFSNYLFKTLGRDFTLTAKWSTNRIITYALDPNGGTQTTENLYVNGDGKVYSNSNCSTEIQKIEIPKKEGYAFQGYKINLDTVIDKAGVIDISKFKTLYDNTTSGEMFKIVAEWKETEVSKITIRNYPRVTYEKGEDLNLDDAQLLVTKSDGSSTPVKITSDMISGYDKNKVGEQTVTVTYKGKTTTFKVKVSEAEVKVTKINLSEENKTLKIGEKFTLEAKVEPDTATNKQVEWKSEDESIATVSSSGEVAAVKEGSTNIVATAKDGSGIKAICKVTVEKQDTAVKVESITLDKKTAELQVGGKLLLKATINPDEATNQRISWDSSNTAVATVKDGLVTAMSEGKTTITVKTEDGGKTDTAEITVVKEINDDKNGPTINSVKGETDTEGIYKVIIKATDESGIGKVTVNGEEITTKDDSGNYYFQPTENGKYEIEVYDTKGNKTLHTHTENNIIKEAKAIQAKDSSGNYIVYIETITNKKVKTVKVNGQEIKSKDDQGRYYFKPSGNGIYKFSIEYEDGTTDNVEYTENRFTNNNTGDPSNGNGNGNNGGTTTTGGSKITGTGNSGSSLTGGTGSIKPSTALTNLPKTGTKMGAFFATIASGIAAVFAWFRQRKEK